MFSSQRNSRSQGNRKKRAKQRPIRPLLEKLEDRITPTGSMNVSDYGQLVTAVQNADNNTTGTYTITLSADTNNYKPTAGAAPLMLKNTNPGTTIILNGVPGSSGGTVALSGGGASRILQVQGANTNVYIKNLTLERGFATNNPNPAAIPFGAVGGAVVNSGGNVAFSNVNFTKNTASAASIGPGVSAAGGGLFSTGGFITLDNVTFVNNQARGGNGNQFVGGGAALGGALGEINTTIVVTDAAGSPVNATNPLGQTVNPSSLPSQTTPLLSVSNNKALGGQGGNGTSAVSVNGTPGGIALGGGLWLNGGTISLFAANINGNSAVGGQGGTGHDSAGAVPAGIGGAGGFAIGGGIEAEGGLGFPTPTLVTTVQAYDSTIANNTAQGGNGGQGGAGVVAGVPGAAGGPGGVASGGGGSIFFTGSSVQTLNTTVANNAVNGGNGGNGGGAISATGGGGGMGGTAGGGGLEVFSFGPVISNLDSTTLAFNSLDNATNSGNGTGLGGKGGVATAGGTSGGVGAPGQTFGGGIDSDGSAEFTNSAVADNTVGTQSNDVAGAISTATTFTYFGNPNGANLLTDPTLFNVATNTPLNNYYGGFKDNGGNLVSANPNFASTSATNNGGPTPTLAIQSSTSPLVTEPGTGNLGFDQRGVARADGQNLGATEFSTAAATVTATGSLTPSSVPFSASTQPVNVSATINVNGANVSKGTVQFELVDSNNNVLPGLTQSSDAVGSNGQINNVTLTLPASAASGTYKLQATYTDANGNAFAAVIVNGTSASPVTLTIQQGAPVSVAAGGSITPTAINVTPTSSATFSANVTLSNSSTGVALSGGTVTFSLVSATQSSNTVSLTPTGITVGTSGQVQQTLTVPAGTAAGGYFLQATYTSAGGVQSQPVDVNAIDFPVILQVQGIPTSITNLAVQSASASGVTVSAAVGATGAVVNEGRVTFSLTDSNGNLVSLTSAAVVNGVTGQVAMPLQANLPPGNYTLTASYSDIFSSNPKFADSSPVSVTATVPQPPPPPQPQPVPLITAAITLFFDGVNIALHGDSPALEQSIQANVPYAVIAGFNIGELLVLAGEMAVHNAQGGNS